MLFYFVQINAAAAAAAAAADDDDDEDDDETLVVSYVRYGEECRYPLDYTRA